MTTTSDSTSTTSTTRQTSSKAWAAREGESPSRLTGGARRRSVPHLLLGVLLVVLCTVGGVFAGMQLANRENVLALAHSVAVGQILSAQDLKQVGLPSDSGVDFVPASAMSAVMGQPVAFSLPAGSLLTRSLLGAPLIPIPGKAIAAVGLKPGQFPPDLSPGTTVMVLTTQGQGATPSTTTGNGQTSSWTAVVAGVTTREAEQTTVVSLQLSESDARALATAPAGQLSLVAIARGVR